MSAQVVEALPRILELYLFKCCIGTWSGVERHTRRGKTGASGVEGRGSRPVDEPAPCEVGCQALPGWATRARKTGYQAL